MTQDERAEELKARAKDQRARADEVLRQQLSTPMGREFVSWLIYELCGLGTPAINIDPVLLALAQARAMVGGTLAKRAAFAARDEWAQLEHERINRALALQPLPEADEDD